MIERRVIRFKHPLLSETEHPAFEAHGAKDGPRLTLMGGIHGCEYSSIAAVTRVMRELDSTQLTGSILAVPVVSVQSYERRSAFVVPEDGKNLNRCFPGSATGSFTDALAHSIFEELIAPADVVLDLHGGDLVEALEPFSIYEESGVEDAAHGIATAFGLPYVVRERRQDGGLSGMTSSAAAAAGIPAVIAEAGGCGQLEKGSVQLLADGVVNVLRHLEMLPGEPMPPAKPMQQVDRFLWLRCASAGWWEAVVGAGDEVAAGAIVGHVKNLWGDVLEEIRAPEDGVVLFLTTSAAVGDNGLLLGLGAGLTPLDVAA